MKAGLNIPALLASSVQIRAKLLVWNLSRAFDAIFQIFKFALRSKCQCIGGTKLYRAFETKFPSHFQIFKTSVLAITLNLKSFIILTYFIVHRNAAQILSKKDLLQKFRIKATSDFEMNNIFLSLAQLIKRSLLNPQ